MRQGGYEIRTAARCYTAPQRPSGIPLPNVIGTVVTTGPWARFSVPPAILRRGRCALRAGEFLCPRQGRLHPGTEARIHVLLLLLALANLLGGEFKLLLRVLRGGSLQVRLA